MKLLTLQKNQLFDAIEASNFNPSQFTIDTRSGFGILELQTKNIISETKVSFDASEFYFSFYVKNKGQELISFCPGEFSYDELVECMHWERNIELFYNWLYYLERETSVIDKWSRFQQIVSSVGLVSSGDTNYGKFTIKEFEDVAFKLDSIKNSLDLISLLPEQIEEIRNQIDYLKDKAKSQSRFDWRNLFVGTIVNVIMQLNVTPENTQLLWSLIRDKFSQYFLQY